MRVEANVRQFPNALCRLAAAAQDSSRPWRTHVPACSTRRHLNANQTQVLQQDMSTGTQYLLCGTVALSSFLLSGCGSADETQLIAQLRELGAIVLPDVNQKASSLILPNDKDQIDGVIELLPKLKHLKSFGAIGSPVTDDALVAVGKLDSLTAIDVSDTGITDAGVAHLVGLPKLSSLNLSGTKVTSQCLPDLGKIESIEMLNLANTELSGGFEHLHGCKISWLVLSHLTLSDVDAVAISEHPQLKRLSASEGVELSETAIDTLRAKGLVLDLPSRNGPSASEDSAAATE